MKWHSGGSLFAPLGEHSKKESYPSHGTCTTLTIGGDKGTVAWADLWNNILLCDALDEHPTLRTLELPPPIALTNSFGSPRSVRDIAVLGGFIKYVEMFYRRVEQQHGIFGDSSPILYTWKVAVVGTNLVISTKFIV
jgi:hypothetical protein